MKGVKGFLLFSLYEVDVTVFSLSHFLFDLRLTPPDEMSVFVEEEEDRAESRESRCMSLRSDHSTPPVFSKEPGTTETQ